MLATLLASIVFSAPPMSAAQLGSWGEETLRIVHERFTIPGSPFLAESITLGDPKQAVAFNWSVGVMLAAYNAGASFDPANKPALRAFADSSHRYWNAAPPVAGFDVVPDATSVDRFYDDNAWMVMALAQSSVVLDDPKYLAWAQEALKFCLSGEDDKLGGGIYWRENAKTSKNTCSNAPVAAACMSVYVKTHDQALLDKAEELYAWTKSHLQDSDDHLMWDSISVSDGHINKTKWSYNTALMIRSAVALYEATHKSEYLHDARQMRVASLQHWLRQSDLALKDDGPFAHLLVESWIEAEGIEPTSRSAQLAVLAGPLVYIHQNCRVQDLYGKRWEKPPAPDARRFQLIDQASAARAFYEVALFLKG